MTRYNYCSEMQMLCARAAKAVAALNDEPLTFFYEILEEGYFRKTAQMPANIAKEELPFSFTERLFSFKEWVINKEAEAALLQKK